MTPFTVNPPIRKPTPEPNAPLPPRIQGVPKTYFDRSASTNSYVDTPQPMATPSDYETSPAVPATRSPAQLLGMRLIQIALDNATIQAGGLQFDGALGIAGNVFWIKKTANTTDEIWVKLNENCDFIPFVRNDFVAGIGFRNARYQIRSAQAGGIVYIAYANDPGHENVRIQ